MLLSTILLAACLFTLASLVGKQDAETKGCLTIFWIFAGLCFAVAWIAIKLATFNQ